MILTVTLNFAVDITYGVDGLTRGETMRVRDVARQAGGKGVNVARVLHALGQDVVVCGFAGGLSGDCARAELRRAGVRDETVDIAGESRLTVMAVEPNGCATGFSEPGSDISPAEWQALRRRFAALLVEAEAVVLSGSVPRGLPTDCYGQLVTAARAAERPVLLDADGEELLAGVSAGPDIVKINAAELRGVTGGGETLAGAAWLQQRGAAAVVISDGPAGMSCVCAGRAWRAAPPRALTGNPTGAGDAAAAALISGLLDGLPWAQRLANAVALSAASVCAPRAGLFDATLYRQLAGQIRASELPAVDRLPGSPPPSAPAAPARWPPAEAPGRERPDRPPGPPAPPAR